ncbi:IQ motif, EF-hand binding site [Trema orientale]|uniref:IQ motif, EF-hand binding site n=1 Tax=Trema orientale TaxID=63057 RepID=A0A2P5C4S7_TREOI|nr:IQ motif, EF-hand binding site [Trema orientale]
MGITGGLVRSVFSKNRAAGTHDGNGIRSNGMEKRRWNSVRSYLCGDELLNSVLAEEDSASFRSFEATTVTQLSSVLAEKDSASVKNSETTVSQLNSTLEADDDLGSVKSSEATVTQPLAEDFAAIEAGSQGEDSKQDIQVQTLDSASKFRKEEHAATTIQSAFRGFLARRQIEGIELKGGEKEQHIVGNGSPDRESLGTSLEAQMGNSVEVFSVVEERNAVRRMQLKLRTQVIKEDWDDSTVSSNISKMRIQNRLEATTRRERALAYAFSQQLRICSKKKEMKSNGKEPHMGWSWLERWMATRLPESSSVESHAKKPVVESMYRNQRFRTNSGFLDIAGEEKESCGSNEVSLSFDGFSVKSANENEGCKPSRNRKTTRSKSRRKTVPSFQSRKDYTKVKKEGSFKGEFKRQKAPSKVSRENLV